MEVSERDRRDARAIGLFYRVKYALMAFGMLVVGIAIVLWLRSLDPQTDRDPGIFPWIAAVGCLLAGPLLLWQAFRRSPR
jgi:hypothetical protein